MSDSLFFSQVNPSGNEAKFNFINKLKKHSSENYQQVYIIDRPLSDKKKYVYSYSDALVVLIPDHKIIIINFSQNNDFENYFEDFIEDLGSLSDKYEYKGIIGRTRTWRNSLITPISNIFETDILDLDIKDFLSRYYIEESIDKKRVELLISLLIGSINNIERVKDNVPNNILDKIKQQIILFDGDQTSFIYNDLKQKRITIQGLSGTGKTELLLHKLKEIYTQDKHIKVAFTCYNKILASNLRSRIPEFFNFMKVEEQIEWEKRLWCAHAWGSQFDRNSGIYRYICYFYNLNFCRYNPSSNFETVCSQALQELSTMESDKIEYAFDFMLIDESQDLPESFFNLCEKVTRHQIYVAGDIFQTIYDIPKISEVRPDFLLSKCYRTDPKTLMFAHAIGLRLFEKQKPRWLKDQEWEACGYQVNHHRHHGINEYNLKREPLRRFEDLQEPQSLSVEIVLIQGNNDEGKIIEILNNIKSDNPTVLPDDIGIIFIDSMNKNYLLADKLEQSIMFYFGWKVNKAYESKQKTQNSIFISNKNNVKGLEFPFVICITDKIKESDVYRNSLYMILTRSFIKTYLLTSEEQNFHILPELQKGLEIINSEGIIKTYISDFEIIQAQTTTIHPAENKGLVQYINEILDDYDIPHTQRSNYIDAVKAFMKGKTSNYDPKQVDRIVTNLINER